MNSSTAKVHSPLYLQLVNDRLWTLQTQEASPARQAIQKKRLQLRRRKKEAKRARKVFDETNNIYTAKPYQSKMIPPVDGTGVYKEDLGNVLCCPDCKEIPPNLVEEFSSGDTVCQSCGVVVGSRIIDTRSEWRTFANDDQAGDDPSRVGGPQDEFIDGEHLATTVAFSESKAHKALARTQNNHTLDKGQKSLMQGYKEIAAYCETIHMGQNVTNAAKHIFKLVDKHKVLRGKSQEAIIAGCIFIACRQNGAARTFKEIYNLTNVGKKEVGRIFKALQTFLLKIQDTEDGTGLNAVNNYEHKAAEAAELVKRYISNMGFKNQQKITTLARDLCVASKESTDMVSRSPLSIAASCIYAACNIVGEPRQSAEISRQSGVSDGTLKNTYKIFYQDRKIIIKEEWLGKGGWASVPYAPPPLATAAKE